MKRRLLSSSLVALALASALALPARAAEFNPNLVTEANVRAGFDATQAAMDKDDGPAANRSADQVLALVRRSSLYALLPEAMLMKGEALMSLDKDAEARKYMLNALGLAQEFGDKRVHANVLNDLGIISERGGNPHAAEYYYRESYALAKTLSDPLLLDAVTFDLGSITCQRGDFETGYALLQEVLGRARSRADRYNEVKLLVRLADTEQDMKQADKASATAKEALSLARQLGHKPSEQGALRVLAMIALDRGDAASAEARLKEALGVALGSKDEWSQASAAFDLGAFYVAKGRTTEASEQLSRAERAFRKLGRQELVEQIRNLLERLETSPKKKT